MEEVEQFDSISIEELAEGTLSAFSGVISTCSPACFVRTAGEFPPLCHVVVRA